MDLEKARKAVDEMKSEGIECELREDYSGRGMYGKSTAAIVVMGDEFRAIQIMGNHEIRSARSDNMGRGIIWY